MTSYFNKILPDDCGKTEMCRNCGYKGQQFLWKNKICLKCNLYFNERRKRLFKTELCQKWVENGSCG